MVERASRLSESILDRRRGADESLTARLRLGLSKPSRVWAGLSSPAVSPEGLL
jgi:hypothetical protein